MDLLAKILKILKLSSDIIQKMLYSVFIFLSVIADFDIKYSLSVRRTFQVNETLQNKFISFFIIIFKPKY